MARAGSPEKSREMGLLRAMSRARKKPSEEMAQAHSQRMQVKTAPALHANANRASDSWPLPGLAPMTRVRTDFGDVHAIALRQGDSVLLKSGEYKQIKWLTRLMLDEAYLTRKPDSNPIEIAAGALGGGAPATRIMVSPRQIICGERFGALRESVEAASLTQSPGIRRHRETGLSYTLMHVGEPADIYCEGLFLHFPLTS